MKLLMSTLVTMFILETFILLLVFLYFQLPYCKWYRKFKKGTWYYTFSEDIEGNTMYWWAKKQPETERVLIVEFN